MSPSLGRFCRRLQFNLQCGCAAAVVCRNRSCIAGSRRNRKITFAASPVAAAGSAARPPATLRRLTPPFKCQSPCFVAYDCFSVSPCRAFCGPPGRRGRPSCAARRLAAVASLPPLRRRSCTLGPPLGPSGLKIARRPTSPSLLYSPAGKALPAGAAFAAQRRRRPLRLGRRTLGSRPAPFASRHPCLAFARFRAGHSPCYAAGSCRPSAGRFGQRGGSLWRPLRFASGPCGRRGRAGGCCRPSTGGPLRASRLRLSARVVGGVGCCPRRSISYLGSPQGPHR